MGSLATWGAIGGAGKGAQAIAENQQKIDFQKLEAAREARMRQFEAEQAAQRQQAGFSQEEKMAGVKQQGAEELQSMEGQQRSELASGEQKWKSGENAADRASAEKIAGIRADAAKTSKSGANKRWESKTVTKTRMGENGVPEQYDNLALFDKSSGRTYMQEGDRFFLQGQDSSKVKRAARSEIQKLTKNPQAADEFLSTYRYLPIEFFQAVGNSGKEETDDE